MAYGRRSALRWTGGWGPGRFWVHAAGTGFGTRARARRDAQNNFHFHREQIWVDSASKWGWGREYGSIWGVPSNTPKLFRTIVACLHVVWKWSRTLVCHVLDTYACMSCAGHVRWYVMCWTRTLVCHVLDTYGLGCWFLCLRRLRRRDLLTMRKYSEIFINIRNYWFDGCASLPHLAGTVKSTSAYSGVGEGPSPFPALPPPPQQQKLSEF